MKGWAEIRRRALADGLSRRTACREHKIHWKTRQRVFRTLESPGFRRTELRRPSILDTIPIVHRILEDDRKAPKTQQHTAVRARPEPAIRPGRLRSVASPRARDAGLKPVPRGTRPRLPRGLDD